MWDDPKGCNPVEDLQSAIEKINNYKREEEPKIAIRIPGTTLILTSIPQTKRQLNLLLNGLHTFDLTEDWKHMAERIFRSKK